MTKRKDAVLKICTVCQSEFETITESTQCSHECRKLSRLLHERERRAIYRLISKKEKITPTKTTKTRESYNWGDSEVDRAQRLLDAEIDRQYYCQPSAIKSYREENPIRFRELCEFYMKKEVKQTFNNGECYG